MERGGGKELDRESKGDVWASDMCYTSIKFLQGIQLPNWGIVYIN